MAGVPHHAAHGYIARLLELGHKVAICEQMADPAKVKGIVPREVVRVITPGLVTERDCSSTQPPTTGLPRCTWKRRASASRCSICRPASSWRRRSRTCAALLGELALRAPREVLVSESSGDHGGESAALAVRLALSRGGACALDSPLDGQTPSELFGPLAAEVENADPLRDAARSRASLRFARACNPGVELPVRRIGHWDPAAALIIDASAASHLELVESPSGTRGDVACGDRRHAARRRERGCSAPPARAAAATWRRSAAATTWSSCSWSTRGCARSSGRRSREIGDLERLAVRAALGEATPRDLGALRDGLARRAACGQRARGRGGPGAARDARDRRRSGGHASTSSAPSSAARWSSGRPRKPRTARCSAPASIAELDELDALRKNGTERMVELEARLREQTRIGTLKVRYTRVFGWYIEVSRTQAARVPAEWRRKQTVASGERFTTPELDELADRILNAEERHRERELALLAELVEPRGVAERSRPRRSPAVFRAGTSPRRSPTSRTATTTRARGRRLRADRDPRRAPSGRRAARRRRALRAQRRAARLGTASGCGSSPAPTWPARARCCARSR